MNFRFDANSTFLSRVLDPKSDSANFDWPKTWAAQVLKSIKGAQARWRLHLALWLKDSESKVPGWIELHHIQQFEKFEKFCNSITLSVSREDFFYISKELPSHGSWQIASPLVKLMKFNRSQFCLIQIRFEFNFDSKCWQESLDGLAKLVAFEVAAK